MIENSGDICLCGHTREQHPSNGPCLLNGGSAHGDGCGDCKAWKGLHCHDCPDLDPEREAAGMICCRDRHLRRRREGDGREWEGIEVARQIDADEAALDEKLSRQAKRAKDRRARKK